MIEKKIMSFFMVRNKNVGVLLLIFYLFILKVYKRFAIIKLLTKLHRKINEKNFLSVALFKLITRESAGIQRFRYF